MVGYMRHSGTDPRGNRRWSFADCLFDEANWTLTVGGTRVAIESKPLELLRYLLLHAEHLVSKDALMDAVWPDVAVVEASLPTAIRKLRFALGDDDRAEHLIETVPRIGYRLVVPATAEEQPTPAPARTGDLAQAAAVRSSIDAPHRRPMLVAAGALAAVALLATILAPSEHVSATKLPSIFSDREIIIALRRLDVAKIDSMLAAGWKPNALDQEGNNALNRLLEMCEWDPGHDRAKMLLVARALLDGGVTLDYHNVWGDTSYSIAKARRYCGPDHPVTVMIRNMCYAHGKTEGDRCLATYEIKPPRPA